ncbi:kinesin-domain-containing protein [Malassezia pachydermatis]|uniref:Kinesin-domain-containing protein n=1 Tax=Malassezia pachydermatis TaxID=77020 RepID=A0A0M8MSW9_9BASI|nr:kinesin-domain-containing protein [Malassezia pachydermatis]KOS12971.1 kinesin-domain-containing protein [Malassezia pachydermatis]
MPPASRVHTKERSALSPMRARASARRVLTNATNKAGHMTRHAAPPYEKPSTTDIHNLFVLEKQRMQATQRRESAERESRRERERHLDERLHSERRIAQEMRPAQGPGWRGYQDYEVDLLQAEHTRTVQTLETELAKLREENDKLKEEAAQQSHAQHQLDATTSALQQRVVTLETELATFHAQTSELREEAAKTREYASDLEHRLQEAEALRRKLHNEVQDLRGNVRVYARVRPPRHEGAVIDIRYPDRRMATQIEVHAPMESATGSTSVKTHAFTFDHVFPPQATQATVFTEVADLLQSVLDGYHTTIFAYGQTGSGKTHTLEGSANLEWTQSATSMLEEEAGLIPRAMHMLWKVAAAQQSLGWSYTFEAQMVEVYLDQVGDLLSAETKCEIRHTPTHTHIDKAVVAPLHSPEDVYQLLSQAKQRRHAAATRMNERSSRSHSIFALRVRGTHTEGEKTDAVLNLVDLAGSERLATSGSGSDAQRLKEAQSINKSLSSLADVIGALATNAKHVPYRNSTLTWLLKPSLSRGSKT